MPHATTEVIGQKRKASDEEAGIEINLNAPEPASKKALRKAKRAQKPSEHNIGITADSKEVEGSVTPRNPQGGGRSQHGIWIGNLPYTTAKSDLLNFLTSDGTHMIKSENISRINLPTTTPKHGKPQNKGFAYVDFTRLQDLEKALQLSEKLFMGRRVLIKNSKSFEGRPSSSITNKKETSGHPPNSRIFVGNLGFDTTVDDLESHFQTCGPVTNIHMATFEDSGKCKGFAWVEFEQLSSAESAMRGWVEVEDSTEAMENKSRKKRIWVGKIEGRKLRMEYAEDRTTRYNKRFGRGTLIADNFDEDDPGRADTNEAAEVNTKYSNRSGKAVKSSEPKYKTSLSKSRKDSGLESPTRRSQVNVVSDSSRYASNTVERLRGSIMPGEGKRVTFD